MTDYRAVMTLLIRKRSYRQIEDQLGCSHRAISRANQALRSLGLTTVQQVAALTNDELDEIFVDKRTSGQGEFVPIALMWSLKPAQGVRSTHCKYCGLATPPPPPSRASGTTATTGSASWLPPMSMRPGLPPGSLTRQGIRCRWIGQGPRCACTTLRAHRVRKSVFSSPRCRIQGLLRGPTCAVCRCASYSSSPSGHARQATAKQPTIGSSVEPA